MKKNKSHATVAIIMGSKNDYRIMKLAAQALAEFEIRFTKHVVSAHRTPDWMYKFSRDAESRGVQIIIAGAGGAAHLPGMVASLTHLPVIGVPITVGKLSGLDALLSIAQMPKGVPVACVAIDNAYNAGLLAARILGATKNHSPVRKTAAMKKLTQRLKSHQMKLKNKILRQKV